jgi:hypothetical protein
MNLEKFININWYLERKPYKNHSSYDIFYLRICRDLFRIIDRTVTEHDRTIDLSKEDCRELAYTFTGYFEDQVNNIGFWNGLIALHRRHFGKRLPFFDRITLEQQEELYEDILPEDIQYLAYITCLNLIADNDEKPIIYFNTGFFVALRDAVFDYLEAIDEVVTTDFYATYLMPADDYIDFKLQLDWFTFTSYLTMTEYQRKMGEHLFDLIEQGKDKADLPPFLYAERDRLMSEVPSSFTAFFPADILAEAMRCNDTRKEDIRNLKWRAHGIFHVQQETPTHYLFMHTATGEQFNVLKSCFTAPINRDQQEYWITTIVGWNNDYYISGLCGPSRYKGEEEIYHANVKMQQKFQRHFAAYRNSILKPALNLRDGAVKFFGSDLVVFDTGYQLQEKLKEYHQWHFKLHADKSVQPKPIKVDLPADVLNAKGVALFIPPQDGFQFILKYPQLINVLQATATDQLTAEAVETTLRMLGDRTVGRDFWFYIKKHYSVRNLSLLMKCPLDDDEDFEALLRIYMPEEFSPLKLLRFTAYSSERMSAEKAGEILKVR